MKTWITYLTALFLGLATALLLGDASWTLSVLGALNTVAINAGILISVLMVIFTLPSAVASLRKDRLGGRLTATAILWSIVTALALPVLTALCSSAFPTVFPVSTSAGSGTISDGYIQSVVASAGQITFSGNLSYFISVANSFLLPLIIVVFLIGLALKPNADVIKPAYLVVNSMSEVMYRMSRGLNYFGYILAYLTSGYLFTVIYQEKTFFADAYFSLALVLIPLALAFILLPVLYEIFTKGKGNPYKILYRNIAGEVAAFSTSNSIFSLPFIMGGARYNSGVQKRISSSSSSIHYLISRGGSASVATFSIMALIANVTNEPVSIGLGLLIALACALASFASSLATGFEVMFITVGAMRMLNINLYSAEVTMIALLPLLGGLGAMLDSMISLLGSAIASRRLGVDTTPSYRDIL